MLLVVTDGYLWEMKKVLKIQASISWKVKIVIHIHKCLNAAPSPLSTCSCLFLKAALHPVSEARGGKYVCVCSHEPCLISQLQVTFLSPGTMNLRQDRALTRSGTGAPSWTTGCKL